MACHYIKLTEVTNDIMLISDLETQVPLLQEFDQVRRPIFAFLEKVQKAKEKQKPETYVYLPDG